MVCSFVGVDTDSSLGGIQWLDPEIAIWLELFCESCWESKAAFALVEWFALILQLRKAWCVVWSTSIVWIKHRVARGCGGSCFLGMTQYWHAG